MIVATGTYDAPHMGQATMLARLTHLTDSLVVGVLSDEFVASYKGERPQWTETERYHQIDLFCRQLFSFFQARIISDQADLIRTLRPNYIAVGSDWHGGQVYLDQLGITQQELDDLQIGIIYVPRTPGISTTEIKRRIGALNHHR